MDYIQIIFMTIIIFEHPMYSIVTLNQSLNLLTHQPSIVFGCIYSVFPPSFSHISFLYLHCFNLSIFHNNTIKEKYNGMTILIGIFTIKRDVCSICVMLNISVVIWYLSI